MKKLIPIYLTNFVTLFYMLTTVPLGYMYQDFPGKHHVVILMATLPTLTCMFTALLSGSLSRKFSSRTLVLAGIACSVLGGLMVRVINRDSLMVCIIGVGLTGVATGLIQTMNYATLAVIVPEGKREKAVGWNDAVGYLGMTAVTVLAGWLAKDGDWARAYNCYFMSAVVLVIAYFTYPETGQAAGVVVRKEKETLGQSQSTVTDKIPFCVAALLLIKFFSAMFNMSGAYYISDLVINETELGSSVLVGNSAMVYSLANVIGSLIVYLFFRLFRSGSYAISHLLAGISLCMIAFFPAKGTILVFEALLGIGVASSHSAVSTMATMAPKGRNVAIATSLFVVAAYFGEFLCSYGTSFAAAAIVGNSLPSSALKVAGIMCVILGIFSIPFVKRSRELAFFTNR